VWLADLGQPIGSEQSGKRPCVIVASELHCRFPIAMTIVVPLTTVDRGLPHHVAVASPASGLRSASWARVEDIRSISHARLGPGPLGILDAAEQRAVSRALRMMLADVGT
jgi:mRNA interferase MazF